MIKRDDTNVMSSFSFVAAAAIICVILRQRETKSIDRRTHFKNTLQANKLNLLASNYAHRCSELDKSSSKIVA